ncbi:MAG: ABC transporter permease [Acholeplasmatales bacterium]|nr:ABC transporter permease [Acholeplasmatales bacterium]
MKSLLIAKSNLRKFKGLSICLTLLIFICSMFITALCLLQTDFRGNTAKNAKKLNTSDAVIMGEFEYHSEDEMKNYLPEGVTDYYYQDILLIDFKYEYDGGENGSTTIVNKENALNRDISKIEIVKEDKSIKDNYIYVPYQFNTAGKVKLGSDYELEYNGIIRTYKVKGFINSTYGGCTNMGTIEFVVQDKIYEEMENSATNTRTFVMYLNFSDTNGIEAKLARYVSDMRTNYSISLYSGFKDLIINERAFMGDIFFVLLLVVVIVVIAITLLAIFNNISNYLKENIKTIGILKAIGYTSNDIKLAIIIQFSIIMILGIILGIFAGYGFISLVSGVLIAQSGIPYTVSFNFVSTIMPIIVIPLFIYLIIILSLLKVKKIEAVNALRDSSGSHLFKKNHMPLEKSKGGLNFSIAIKNTFHTLKQNIINIVVIIFLTSLLVTAVTFYENFDRNPNFSLMVNEYCDVFVGVNKESRDEVYAKLQEDDRVEKIRLVSGVNAEDKDYITLYISAYDNMDNYRNTDYAYKGRLPKYDNEIAISGKYAKSNGYSIGDEIELSFYDTYKFKITGLVQSTNNMGREAVLSFDGLEHIYPECREKVQTIYFEVKDDDNIDDIIAEYKELYDGKITQMISFDEIATSALGTFKTLSRLLVLITIIISISNIGLVLYILLRSLIYKRRFEYGILKAIGFTSRQLVLQNIMAFLPLIVIGTVVGCIINYFLMNPMFTLAMNSFGIMKCTLLMPIDLIIICGIFLIIISALTIYLMSRRIKKIEPYKLLIVD